MTDFVSPVNNLLVPLAAKAVLPLAWRSQQLRVTPTLHSLDTFEQLKESNTVVLVNHTDRLDPLVVFSLSRFTRENFFYLSARELFVGLDGWLLQQCGAYSVVRGEPGDAQSRETTIDLIVNGERKLVEFPEGDVSGRDDEILPLKTDGLRNLIEAQRRLVSQKERAVYLLPTVIYYSVTPDSKPLMEHATAKLEVMFSIAAGSLNLEDRLDILVGVVVDQFERKYRATSIGSYQERLRALVAASVRAFAKSIAIELGDEAAESEAVALYSLRSAIRNQRIESKSLTRVLDILQQLLILASTLDQRQFTLEKAWRVLDRLELLLTGKSSKKGKRTARVATADPINLRDLLDSIGWNEALAVPLLETRVRSAMKSTLLQMQSSRSLQKA